jgi:signal transduction histidine kinase
MATVERRRGPTARARIIAWVMLLVTVVLAANLLIAMRVLDARARSRLDDELGHEYRKLATFVERFGDDHASVDDLLDAYLSSTVPEKSETYFSVVDRRPDRRSSNEPLARLDLDDEFVATVGAVNEPDSGTFASAAGEVRFGVFPVSVPGDVRHAALVVVEFAAPERAETAAVMRTLVVVSTAALVVAGVGAWLIAGRLLRPIRAVRETAASIGESDLTRRIKVDGDDDVAELARTFNRMLDRIETAFEAQRTFLDDAGHELRTPITIVRGHLEVLGEDPAERARVMPLVIGELVRMGRIVDDLLVLARAERPDFLTLGPVDITDLTVDAVIKARPLADRRWTVSEVADVVAVADGQRLTQALIQLVTNAVAHSAPGEPIDVGSAYRGGEVLLWVRDGGRGIAEDRLPRLFDRFYTTGEGGDAVSTGLGLAIVRSIAEAHGGEVGVDSRPEAGATFTLHLPLTIIVAPDNTAEADDISGISGTTGWRDPDRADPGTRSTTNLRTESRDRSVS